MRYIIALPIIFCLFFISAQENASGGGFDFLVGFKGGVNFSTVVPTRRFSIIQSVNGTDTPAGEKDYSPFYRNPGYQYGFTGMLKFTKTLSISLEPTFSSYSYKYATVSSWFDESNPADRIEIKSEFTDKLKYFEIPVVLRYEFGDGQIRPYLAAGFFYAMLTGGNGNAKTTTTQYINDIGIELDNTESPGVISGNYISTRLATFPGAGVFADFSFATVFAEADYYISLHNIVNESARYSNQQSVGGTYNVPDNLSFNNLVINIGILFNINSKELSGGGKGKGKGAAVACPVIKQKR